MKLVFQYVLIAYVAFLTISLPSAWSDSNSSNFSFGTGVSSRIRPQDYLYAPNPESRNDLFEQLKPVEASVNLGIGSDCGKINVEGTLKSTFGKVLSGDYFKGLTEDILGSAPMLAACYMSPTWCAILKHTQLSANFLTQTRLNQCQIIDKYTDSRVEDYYRNRQDCVHQAIQDNGGDMDAAMASCQNGLFNSKAGKWAGSSKDDPSQPNALIGDSITWAGFSGQEGTRIGEVLKALVGDTVVAQGNVSVEYGGQAHASSPRSYLLTLQDQVRQSFCEKLLPEIAQKQTFINDSDIQKGIDALPTASSEQETSFLTPEVVRNLAYLPPIRRERICLKLSQAMAMSAFTRDMNRSLDVLTAAGQNPNLPPNRKSEINEKRTELKDQIDLTLKLRQEQDKPVNEVMQYIAQEGLAAQDEAVRSTLTQESTTRSKQSHYNRMNDCADGIFCGNAGSP
jgi:hypothetical protein